MVKELKIKSINMFSKFCNKFKLKTMKGHHALYLKSYVLLLADVFEKFRNRCLEDCGLCPSHYLIAAALSSDAMLSMTKVRLDFISDNDMYFKKKKK